MNQKNITIAAIIAALFIGSSSFVSQQPSVPEVKSAVITPVETVTSIPTPTFVPIITPTHTPTPTYIYPTATAIPVQQPNTQQTSGLSNDNYYTNSEGNQVHSPAFSNTAPAGATAQCADGTYSFSQSRRGTCSGHGGVSQWL